MNNINIDNFVAQYLEFRKFFTADTFGTPAEGFIVSLFQTYLKEIREREVAALRMNGNGGKKTQEPPICPKHNSTMKKSKYGGYYCTSKNEDGSYCNEKIK